MWRISDMWRILDFLLYIVMGSLEGQRFCQLPTNDNQLAAFLRDVRPGFKL